jgi:hypothetical protein
MNTQTPIVRRLLSLTLACGLLAALPPSARAELEEPLPESLIQGCGRLLVIISGTSAKVDKVTCQRGYFRQIEPPSGEVSAGRPVVVTLEQSSAYGPECTISIGGQDRATVALQQNFCFLKGGAITASVVNGNATLTETIRGGFPSIPGMALFSLGF